MKNTIIVTTILFILVVGGYVLYGTFFMEAAPAPALPEEEQNGPLSAEALELEAEGSFVSIMQSGKPVECLFSYKNPEHGGRSEGTFFYAERKFAIEAVTAYDGVPYNSQIVSDGTFTYMWGESPNGAAAIKVAVPKNDGGTPEAGPGFKLDQPVSYTCSAWNVDQTRLVPPSDVTFLDMTAMYEATIQGVGE